MPPATMRSAARARACVLLRSGMVTPFGALSHGPRGVAEKPRCRWVRARGPLLDTVFLELVVQRRCLDPEQARRLGLDAPGLGVSLQDQLAFEVVEDLGQR